MFRDTMFELLDCIKLTANGAEKTERPRRTEPADKSGEHQASVAAMNAGSVSRFFAASPVWTREVGFFEVGNQRLATRC